MLFLNLESGLPVLIRLPLRTHLWWSPTSNTSVQYTLILSYDVQVKGSTLVVLGVQLYLGHPKPVCHSLCFLEINGAVRKARRTEICLRFFSIFRLMVFRESDIISKGKRKHGPYTRSATYSFPGEVYWAR